MPAPAPPAQLLTAGEVAARLRVTERALRGWRSAGIGPAYIPLAGGQIRYSPDAVDAYLAAQLQPTTRAAS